MALLSLKDLNLQKPKQIVKSLEKVELHNVSIIIQARMNSSRLPGKVLREFLPNTTILDLQLASLNKYRSNIIIATSAKTVDNAIADFAKKNTISVYRGDEGNVMKRFLDCSSSKIFVRVCADNPFVQITDIERWIEEVESGLDYISYCDSLGVPAIKKHWGLFVEVFTRSTLSKAHELTEREEQKNFYREHVTNFIYENPDVFKVKLKMAPLPIINRGDLRFTIDTLEDFKNMSNLYSLLHKDYQLEDLIQTSDLNPDIHAIMKSQINLFEK